jgi:acetyl esterase/lipase
MNKMEMPDLGELRSGFVRMMTESSKPLLRSSVEVVRLNVPGPEKDKSVPIIVYTPTSRTSGPLPGILHIHGGGFIAGNAEMNAGYCQSLAEDVGCVVASIDYRLAPENPFPAGLEDCYSALQWFFESAKSIGVNAKKIAITGECAGGGLAAQLAVVVRDRKEYSITLQALIYPMLDNRTGISIDPGVNAGKRIWTKHDNERGWNSYLEENARLQSELPPHPSSPTRIEKLQELAPVFIAVGDSDLLARECAVYAQHLIEQGVPVELHIYRGATHGFDIEFETWQSKAFIRDRNMALRRAFDD